MGIFDFLGFTNKAKKVVRHNLNPDSVKEHHIIRGLSNQVAELQASLAKYASKEFKKKESDEQISGEEKIKEYLHNDKKRLEKQNVQTFFSLKAFFEKYLKDEKFRKNCKITTFDRSHNLGTFGDLGFVGNQFVILNDKNKKVFGARELRDVFQSVGALKNDISALRIPINLDKDGVFIENLMLWEAPEIINEEDGIRYSKARKRRLYELLAEKNAMIQQKCGELEEAEMTIIKLQDKIDELGIGSKVNEKSGEIARAERVKTAEKISSIEKAWGDTTTELTNLRRISVLQEDEIRSILSELGRLREKAEREGIALKFDEVVAKLDRVKDLFRQRTLVQSQNPQNNSKS